MVGQSYRQSDDGQCRVGVAGGGKYRTTGNKQIARAKHATVGINYTMSRVIRHASCANEMSPGRLNLLSNIGLNVITVKSNIANSIATKIAIKKPMSLCNARDVAFVIMEIQHSSPHSEWIQIIGQRYAAIAMRRLFSLVP